MPLSMSLQLVGNSLQYIGLRTGMYDLICSTRSDGVKYQLSIVPSSCPSSPCFAM